MTIVRLSCGYRIPTSQKLMFKTSFLQKYAQLSVLSPKNLKNMGKIALYQILRSNERTFEEMMFLNAVFVVVSMLVILYQNINISQFHPSIHILFLATLCLCFPTSLLVCTCLAQDCTALWGTIFVPNFEKVGNRYAFLAKVRFCPPPKSML